MARATSLNLSGFDTTPVSETFGQDASFRLEQPIGSMSISPSGRDVVLASREGLHIIDLDSPYSPPRYLPHRTPWEVADVQWSPFAARDYWIVSTSNQKALVWNVGAHGWRDAIEFVLHGHSRALTDINFSAHHPDMLATCAVDSFVHGWDLRAPARPAFSFSDWFAGATQVKFSRQDEHLIASAHDRYLHIWDKRKGAYPARTIEAHGTKIYGVDWNRFEHNKIVTCSLDKTIKFWDINEASDVPERVIETAFPVWRARHTPFGWGLLAMPQRGSNDLHLYDRRPLDRVLPGGQVKPVTIFPGHKGQVKEFLWRTQGSVSEGIDHREFQLVSWGADRELRLHCVADETLHAIGYEKGVSNVQRLNLTRRGAKYRTFRDGSSEPYSPLEFPARTDSFPLHHQFLNPRNRHSTSIGMSKMHASQFRGWLNAGRRERRTGMHGKGAIRQETNPIEWMKNVKIASWDHDSLAEEITQVGERFVKVEFESVDIKQRKAVMVLRGPWGEQQGMVWMRIDFRFPKMYPRNACAVVTVQKTSAIQSDIHRNLSTEVHTIAETFQSQQRGCIEAIVRYLLAEQSMEEIVSILLGENEIESKIAGELSSDSDDEVLNGPPDASSSSANIRVPLAKMCGALWANDGRLVCFFPRRRPLIEPVSLLVGAGPRGLDESQSSRLFEGFGRLQTDSPARKSINGTEESHEDTHSDTSDVSSTLSSRSSSYSSSSEAGAVLRNRFGLQRHPRSEERSNKSTTVDGTKTALEYREIYVSIRDDVRELLPAKKYLAERYRVLGDGKSVCQHNASVAEHAGLMEIASVWRLAALILERKVPLEVINSHEQTHTNILLIARQSELTLRRRDSGIDLGAESAENSSASQAKGATRWGNSPLASAYLVTAMFSYFEKMADIQMLATLSSVFGQIQQGIDSGVDKESQLKSVVTGPDGCAYYPNVSVARSAIEWKRLETSKPSSGTVMALSRRNSGRHLNIPDSHSQHQRKHIHTTTAGPEYTTIHVNNRELRSFTDIAIEPAHRTSEKSVLLSTSPEDSRSSRRSTSEATFAASRASLNALAQTFSRSPPSNHSTAASSLKKPSPSTSFTAGNWSGALFGRESVSRGSRNSTQPHDNIVETAGNSQLRSSVSSVSLHGSRGDSRRTADTSRGSHRSGSTVILEKRAAKSSRKRTTKTQLYNQNQFDLDGYADRPLLDVAHVWKYQVYQTQYAHLLEVWGLWIQRAELLQMDVFGTHKNTGKHQVALQEEDIGLQVIRCCHDCGTALQPIQKNKCVVGWHCPLTRCPRKVSKHQICAVCQSVVRGLNIPCLQCGHITCYECAKTWFGTTVLAQRQRPSNDAPLTKQEEMSESEEAVAPATEPDCPAGCGCSCTTLTDIDVPYPMSSVEDDKPPDHDQIPPSMTRHSSGLSQHSNRTRHHPGPDTALGAMMALSSRSRAPSTTTLMSKSVATDADTVYEHDQYVDDELMPWASGRFTTLGRGIGGGLSRGLSARSSDATIRKL